MKTLLRSVMVSDPTDSQDQVLENYRHLDQSGIQFSESEDTAIWSFVSDFVTQHQHTPSMSTVESHFSRTGETTTVDRLQMLRGIKLKTRGDFLRHLETKAEDKRRMDVGRILQEAAEIVSKGIQMPGTKKGEKIFLQGPVDAMRYILEQAHAVVTPTSGARLSGDVVHDGADFLNHFDKVKNDPLAGVGQYVGIRQIDEALGGAKKFELWTHAAFTGGLKSTLMINWAYNQSVYYGHSSLIFSLEMPYVQVRNILYAMHSGHEKFKNIHGPIPYQGIREGNLTADEEKFLRDHVVPDFNQTDEYGSIMIEVADPNKADFTVTDMRARAETMYSKTPFKLLFVDHALLVAPKRWVANTTDRLNEVIRDCKKMAMSFNKGAGIAVVLLFQISREGYKAALKARGLDRIPSEKDIKAGRQHTPSDYVYDLTHLSYANECVTGNTLIPTNRGLVRISEVEAGDSAWSRTGWKKVVRRIETKGQGVIYQIRTNRGWFLEATYHHRLMTLCPSGYRWKTVQDLEVGDQVVGIDRSRTYEWPNQEVLLPRPLGRKTYLCKMLAYLMGLVSSWCWAYKSNSFAEVAIRRVLDEAGLPPVSSQWHFWREDSVLRSWLMEEAHQDEVPEIILQSPRAVVLAYLSGLSDQSELEWMGQKLTMRSHDFAVQIHQMVSLLGHPFGIYFVDTTDKHASVVRRIDDMRNTSFRGGEIESDGFPILDLIARVATEEHLEEIKAEHVKDGLVSRQFCIEEWARKPWYFCGSNWDPEDPICQSTDTFIRSLQRLSVSVVESVTQKEHPGPVYDLEVEGDHEYQTGAFSSHNCERSSDVVTATWVDHQLKENGEVLFQCLKTRDMEAFKPFKASIFWPVRRIRTLDDPSLEDLNSASNELDLDVF